MKALSLRQPWAHAVLHYGKTIENRRWNTTFRGPFLIHAAKGMTRGEYLDAEEFIADACGWTFGGSSGIASRAAFDRDFRTRGARGGIVGRARLVDVIRPCAAADGLFAACPHRWHIPDQYGFVLADVESLPFLQWRGELVFFEVPDAALEPLWRARDVHASAAGDLLPAPRAVQALGAALAEHDARGARGGR